MTQDRAEQMIREIGAWLEAGAPGATLDEKVDDTVAADLARKYCSELLDYANATSFGGCKFCQG